MSGFWLWDSHCKNPVVGVENGFRICSRINDLGSTLISVSALDRRLTDFLLLSPVRFSLLSGLSFHLVEFSHQHAFVIELVTWAGVKLNNAWCGRH